MKGDNGNGELDGCFFFGRVERKAPGHFDDGAHIAGLAKLRAQDGPDTAMDVVPARPPSSVINNGLPLGKPLGSMITAPDVPVANKRLLDAPRCQLGNG